jgi:hypothetical protein
MQGCIVVAIVIDWTQTEEGESEDWQMKKINFGLVFNYLERGEMKL